MEMKNSRLLLLGLGMICTVTIILIVTAKAQVQSFMRLRSLDEVFLCDEFVHYSDAAKLSIRMDFLLHPEKTIIESLLGVSAKNGDLFTANNISRSREMIQQCSKLQALTGEN